MAPEGPTGMPPLDLQNPQANAPKAVNARRMRLGLGTWVVIEATSRSASCALRGLEAAFGRIRHVQERMHPEREGSDLRRLRDAPAGTAVPIDPATWTVLRFAQRLFELSGGVFDPCLPRAAGRLCDLELSSHPLKAWARAHAPLSIDCGGIAKGYAVDCALDALRAAGCFGGLVNAGGDLRVYGPDLRTLLLRRPDGSYMPCELREAALAVSDLDATNRPAEHRGYYVRESRVGGPKRFAAVRAPVAMVADALTKCVVLCPPAVAQALMRELSAEILA